MAFARPTREQIRRRIQSDFQHAFGNDAVLYQGTIEYAFCEAMVGLSHAKHGRLDRIYRDSFPHLASGPALVKWGAFYGVFPNKATYATGLVRFNGINTTAIPLGTIVVRSDGVEYRTLEAGEIGVPESLLVRLPVQARVPGLAGNTESADVDLKAQPSIVGVSSSEVTLNALSGGADAEEIEAFRARLLAVLAEPPGGGKIGDYVAWAKLVTGITRAWEYGNVPKVGDVTVLVMRDLDVNPFPGAPELATVLAQIVEFAPIGLPTPTVQAPVELPLLLEIELTIEDGAVTADVRTAIIAAIREMLITRSAPPADVGGGVLYRSWITEAISGSTGEKDHKLLSPLVDVDLAQWAIPTLADGAITWTP